MQHAVGSSQAVTLLFYIYKIIFLFCLDLWREFFLCRKSIKKYYYCSSSWPDKGQSKPQGILQVTPFLNTLSEAPLEGRKSTQPNCNSDHRVSGCLGIYSWRDRCALVAVDLKGVCLWPWLGLWVCKDIKFLTTRLSVFWFYTEYFKET